ncbi:MAG: hypothetical protein ACPHID_03185 [Thermoplasmatota archaeon]
MGVFETFRLLHIFFAILWAGGGLFWAFVAKPLTRLDPDVYRSFYARSIMGPYLGMTALLTVVFGFVTFFTFPGSYEGAQNAILGVGMLAGIVGLLIGWIGHMPNAIKLSKLLNDDGDEDLIALRFRREDRLHHASAGAIAVALVSMLLFRLF